MFDDKCVPEPLGIVLNMLVDPCLSACREGTECVQSPDVVDENVRIGSGIGSSVVLRSVHARVSFERTRIRYRKRNAAHNQAARGELCIMPHRAEAPYHRALQVGWSRFRAVLMLSTF